MSDFEFNTNWRYRIETKFQRMPEDPTLRTVNGFLWHAIIDLDVDAQMTVPAEIHGYGATPREAIMTAFRFATADYGELLKRIRQLQNLIVTKATTR